MIGLFDSGIGGLSVMRALEQLAPSKGFLYYADTANFPYGQKTPVEIERCASKACAYLLSQGATCIVVACHTASVYALENLKERFPVPIIGISEDISLLIPPQKKVAILATVATIQSGLYQRLLPDAIPLACPGLAEQIENSSSDIQGLLKQLLAPLLETGIENVFLGCTHYSHIRREIEEELDPETQLIDPALFTAKRALPYLNTSNKEEHAFYASGDAKTLQAFLTKHPFLLDHTLTQVS